MKTWEVYKIALENSKAKFKRLSHGDICYMDEKGQLKICGNISRFPLAIVDEDWELVPQEVTWQEAVSSWLEGNRVVCEYKGNKAIFDAGGLNMAIYVDKEKLKYGKWFVR